MDIGKSIKKLRKESGLKQNEFAESVGVSQSHLSQIEKGHKKPSLTTLEQMADILQVPLPVLFWFGVEEEDVKPAKREAYNILIPSINGLVLEAFME